jgi:hypothetical protein
MISCGKSGTTSKSRKEAGENVVTLPFDVTAICRYTYVGPDTLSQPKCTEPLNIWRAIVDGEGTGTPTGGFKVHFDFCGDSLNNYGNVEAYMALADGDTIYVTGYGRVIDGRLVDHPDYVTSFWRDQFIIMGGTGKYGGASGYLVTDDYNSSEDPFSHHHWKGTITMKKVKTPK